jgi:hypothetical protein
MNVEIRTEAAQFSEKKYINGIFLAGPHREGVINETHSSRRSSWKLEFIKEFVHFNKADSYVSFYVTFIYGAMPFYGLRTSEHVCIVKDIFSKKGLLRAVRVFAYIFVI